MRKILFLISIIIFFSVTGNAGNSPKNDKNGTESSIKTIDRLRLVEFAKNYLGTPYLYASTNPLKGFDCSGFVHFVFKNFNIELPHSSKSFNSLGAKVKPEEFKVGDVLVFYGYRNSAEIGHVGIICEANGMKSKFIHSSSGKVKGVTISELSSEMYTRRFYKCVDVIDSPNKSPEGRFIIPNSKSATIHKQIAPALKP